jgi:hypothetical protein
VRSLTRSSGVLQCSKTSICWVEICVEELFTLMILSIWEIIFCYLLIDIHFSSKNLMYFKRNTTDRPRQLENVIQINKINEGKLFPQSSETPLPNIG